MITSEELSRRKKMLHELVTELLTNSYPTVQVTIDGTTHYIEGPEAKYFGCGLKIALDAIDVEIQPVMRH